MDHKPVNKHVNKVISNTVACMRETNKGMELMKILVPSSFTVIPFIHTTRFIEHLVYLRHFLDADTSVNKTAKTHDPKDVSCVCMHVAVYVCVSTLAPLCAWAHKDGFRGRRKETRAGTRAGLSLLSAQAYRPASSFG